MDLAMHPRCIRCGDEHHTYDGRGLTCGYCGLARSTACHVGAACPALDDPADDLAARVVTAIVRDLNDRRGLALDGLDEETRADIIAAWRDLVANIARGAP